MRGRKTELTTSSVARFLPFDVDGQGRGKDLSLSLRHFSARRHHRLFRYGFRSWLELDIAGQQSRYYGRDSSNLLCQVRVLGGRLPSHHHRSWSAQRRFVGHHRLQRGPIVGMASPPLPTVCCLGG